MDELPGAGLIVTLEGAWEYIENEGWNVLKKSGKLS